ncbi:energy transducer TonB [Zoogloea sp.]|uniref:energy transducer TonB n=1 Tax=Zoogloea sp. TaxID=49181 RepID=UPI0035B4BD0A
MNIVVPPSDLSWPRPAALPRPLRVAIGLSIGVHALALLVEGRSMTPPPEPPPLEVVLRRPAPAPVPIPVAEPAPSLPQPRAEAPAPARLARVEAAPRVARPEPRPAPVLSRPAAQAPVNTPALRIESPPAAPQTPAAFSETPPQAAAPVAARAAPVEPVVAAHAAEDTLDPALLERYGRSLSSLFARQQNYPRVAAMRGWEGEVQVRVTIARKGNIVAAQVVRSSGFEVLDQSAVQLVSGAGPLPRPPEALQNRELQIVVPVLFKLEKPA